MTYYSDKLLQEQLTASGAILQDHLDNHPSGEVSLEQLTTTSGDIITYVDQEIATVSNEAEVITLSGAQALSFPISYDDTFPKYLFHLDPNSFISRANFVTETTFSGAVTETLTLSSPGVADGGGNNTFIDKYSSIPHGSLVTRIKIYAESSAGILLKIGINYPDSSTAWDIYTVGSGNHTGSGWEYLELDRPFLVPNYGYSFPGYYAVNGASITNNSQTPTTADDYFSGDAEGKKVFRVGQSSYQRLITAEYTDNEYILKGGSNQSLYIADQIHPVHHINDLTGSGTWIRPLEYYNNILSTSESIPVYLDRFGDANTMGSGNLYINVGFPESSASTGGVSSTTDGIAAESLPQYRMIYADSTASGYLGLGEYDQTEVKANVFGMVTQDGGISASSTGEITLLGKITNPAWSWNPNADLWLSSSGTLTETKPTADSVYAIPCGHSLLEPTEIWLSPKTGWKIGASNISAAGPLVRGAVEGRFDRNSDTELIWTPVNGNGIGLWNGYEWRLVTPATNPTAANTATTLSGVSLAVDCLYDVFAEYVSDDEFQFVFKHWDGATAGASDRGYSLYQHQGVYVEADTTDGKKRRWLGIAYSYNNSSTVNFKDEKALRLICNHYNKQLKNIGMTNPYSSDTSDSGPATSWEKWNSNSTDWDVYFVTNAESGLSMYADLIANTADTSATLMVGIGLNSGTVLATGASTGVNYNADTASNVTKDIHSTLILEPSDLAIGYNYITPLQKVSGPYTANFSYWFESGGSSAEHKAQFQGLIKC